MAATKVSGRSRRDCLTIMGDLLENMQQPTRLTHMLYRTNLSYAQIKKYLDIMTQMGLAEEVAKPFSGFLITERGRVFVQLIASHPRKDKLESFEMMRCMP